MREKHLNMNKMIEIVPWVVQSWPQWGTISIKHIFHIFFYLKAPTHNSWYQVLHTWQQIQSPFLIDFSE
jgi:hypothetical protein